jgi:hypothetical protein
MDEPTNHRLQEHFKSELDKLSNESTKCKTFVERINGDLSPAEAAFARIILETIGKTLAYTVIDPDRMLIVLAEVNRIGIKVSEEFKKLKEED